MTPPWIQTKNVKFDNGVGGRSPGGYVKMKSKNKSVLEIGEREMVEVKLIQECIIHLRKFIFEEKIHIW